MTRELAVIHARENIRVNALCPGPLKTPLLMEFLNTEAKKQRRLVHVPMGRFGIIKIHHCSIYVDQFILVVQFILVGLYRSSNLYWQFILTILLGEAIEQAKAALFLASDESSFITGTDFKVDGGITAAYVTPEGETASKGPASLSSTVLKK
jgi:NAD(P)-dependent dehydrogenase (short-subunit alcohol dehydrogenase family)